MRKKINIFIVIYSFLIYFNKSQNVDIITIDNKMSKTEIQKLFMCHHIRPVGPFNEYYQICLYQRENYNNIELIIKNKIFIPSTDLPTDPRAYHIEIYFPLLENSTLRLINSSIISSAIHITGTNLYIDTNSSLNSSYLGLIYGAGYNTWYSMGGGYGGTGGATLSEDKQNCNHIGRNNFLTQVGSILGDWSYFRGYGSGGGYDTIRGGGRLNITMKGLVVISGSLISRGADANDIPEIGPMGAGSGGLIYLHGKDIKGSGCIDASGGHAIGYNKITKTGGGGGGGGGRIIIIYQNKLNIDVENIFAYGGRNKFVSSDNMDFIDVQNCQLGGDGTILQLKLNDITKYTYKYIPKLLNKGLLVIKGSPTDSVDGSTITKTYGTTPIYQKPIYNHDTNLTLADFIYQLTISNGASVSTDYLELEIHPNEEPSEIIIDSSSKIHRIPTNNSIQISANTILIDGHIEPITSVLQEAEQNYSSIIDTIILTSYYLIELKSNTVLTANTIIISSIRSIITDDSIVITFDENVLLKSNNYISLNGFFIPESIENKRIQNKKKIYSKVASDYIYEDIQDRITTKNITIDCLQNVSINLQPIQQKYKIHLHIISGNQTVINIPSQSPYFSISVSAFIIKVYGKHSGTSHSTDSDNDTCEKMNTEKFICDKKNIRSSLMDLTYRMIFVAESAIMLSNITTDSLLICCKGTTEINGIVSLRGKGCGAGNGPGKSHFIVENSASGGAGHGGKGGGRGAGMTYEISNRNKNISPQWPGSAASQGLDMTKKIIGGSGGGVIFIKSNIILFTGYHSTLTAAGSDGHYGGGGGSGGSVVLQVYRLDGLGKIDASGGCACSKNCMYNNKNCTDCKQCDKGNETNLSHLETKDNVKPNNSENIIKNLVYLNGIRKSLLSATTKPNYGIGGGGGGGIIQITYENKGNGIEFVNKGGIVTVEGGQSEGDDSYYGHKGMKYSLNCPIGHGGIFCLPCPAGKFKNNHTIDCEECPAGTYSNHTGFISCNPCLPGFYTPNNKSLVCLKCPSGFYTNQYRSTRCTMCPKGYQNPYAGSTVCEICDIGTIAPTTGMSNCTLCGKGETTLEKGSTECFKCHRKPRHSVFNTRGKCTYACEKGYVGIDCLTPFEKFVEPIGGPLGFILIVFGIILLLFSLWGFISYHKNSVAAQKYPAPAPPPSSVGGGYGTNNNTLLLEMTSRLTGKDLDAHLERIYFEGVNFPWCYWSLNPSFVPDTIQSFIYEGSYVYFANECNKILSWKDLFYHSSKLYKHKIYFPIATESLFYYIIYTLFPPLSIIFLSSIQRQKVQKLDKYVQEYGAGFFRDIDARSIGAKVKLGYSLDLTLGFLDILYPGFDKIDTSPESQQFMNKNRKLNNKTGKSPLKKKQTNRIGLINEMKSIPTILNDKSETIRPLTDISNTNDKINHINDNFYMVLVSGRGNFLNPYYLDTHDIYLRSIPTRLHLLKDNAWIELIANLNRYLRVLTGGQIFEKDKKEFLKLILNKDTNDSTTTNNNKIKHLNMLTNGIYSDENNKIMNHYKNETIYFFVVIKNIILEIEQFNKQYFLEGFQISFGHVVIQYNQHIYNKASLKSNFHSWKLNDLYTICLWWIYLCNYKTRTTYNIRLALVIYPNMNKKVKNNGNVSEKISISNDIQKEINILNNNNTKDDIPIDLSNSKIRKEALFDDKIDKNSNQNDKIHTYSIHLNELRNEKDLKSDYDNYHTPLLIPSIVQKFSLYQDMLLKKQKSLNNHSFLLFFKKGMILFKMIWNSMIHFRHDHSFTFQAQYPWLLPGILLFLISCDLLITFFLYLEFFCVQVDDPTQDSTGCSHIAFLLINTIFPGAIILAPLTGIIFVLRHTTTYGRLFAVWNSISMVNYLLAFICSIIYFTYLHIGFYWLTILGLGIKKIEKVIVIKCIAQFENERTGRGWRGLYVTRKYYDSGIYPPGYYN